MKRFAKALLVSLALLVPAVANATNTYITTELTDAMTAKYGVLGNGRNFWTALYSFEEALLTGTGGTLVFVDDANNLINGGTALSVDAAFEKLTAATATNGAYDIGFDAAGGFSQATVGLALTELTDTGAATGAQIVAVDATAFATPFDNCVNVEECLLEFTETGAAAGAQLVAVEAATVGAVFDNCVNVEECLVELGSTGANEGASIITLVAATGTACDTAADLDECIVSLIGATPTATNGCNISGYDDSGSQTAAATACDALDQIYGNVNRIFIPVHQFRECATGDVTNAEVAATDGSGGILASDTTPSMIGTGGTVAQAIQWVTTNEDKVCTSVMLPPNFSGASNVTINVYAAADTADADNTEIFDVITSWQEIGAAAGADVTDATAALAATDTNIQALAATVALADIPDAAFSVSLMLSPNNNTNNNLWVYGIEIVYVSE